MSAVSVHTGELYQGLLELSGLAVALFDRDGRRIFVNDHAVRLSGMSREELLKGRLGDNLVLEDREKALEAFQKCVTTGEPVRGLVLRGEGQGQTRYESGNLAPLRNARGEIIGVQATFMEITDFVKAQECLRRSQELYRTLVEAAGCVVMRANREGRRTFVSDYSTEIHGRSKEELLSGRFGDSLVPEEREGAWELLRQTFQTGEPVRGRVTRHLIQGQVRYFSSNWMPIRDANGNVVEIQTTSTDITEQVMLRQQLELYSSRMRRAQEDERLSISQFLHDDTIQTLLAISHTIQALLAQEEVVERVREKMEQIRRVLLDQVEALRRLTVSLRPAILDQMGLEVALRWFVRQMCQARGIESVVRIGGGWKRLSPTVEVRLFRIVQEAVNNAVRHGAPRKVEVSLNTTDGRLDLMVRDDGQGFVPPRSAMELLLQGRLGLVGMQERARALGAELAIESRPGAGTCILLRGQVERMEQTA